MTKRNRRDLAALYPKVELFREAVNRALEEAADEEVVFNLTCLAASLHYADYWYREALVSDATQKGEK